MKSDAKSVVWDKFNVVVESATLSPVEHVQCESCKSFLTYESSETGPPHLQRHRCKTNLANASIASFLKPTNARIPAAVKDKLTLSLAHFCAKDMQPCDIVSGRRFAKVG